MRDRDVFSASRRFAPAPEPAWGDIEPRAVGAVLVLLTLISGLGYGGWTVFREIQKVHLGGVEQPPAILEVLDPLAGMRPREEPMQETSLPPETAMALLRLYQPGDSDTPKLIARDGPIATLPVPIRHSPGLPDVAPQPVMQIATEVGEAAVGPAEAAPHPILQFNGGVMPLPRPAFEVADLQVVGNPPPPVRIVAVRPAWVRVTSAGGTILLEKILNAGDTFEVPATRDAASLRVGDSGAIYFLVDGQHYGPVGAHGKVTKQVTLAADHVSRTFRPAEPSDDQDLARSVRMAEATR